MFSLTNKVAIITGGGSGIGRATAARFIAAGAEVVIADLVDPSDVAAELGATAETVDVADADGVRAMVEAVAERCGRLDVLVNNAGILGPGLGLTADSLDDARKVLDVNLMGVAHGIRAAVDVMELGGCIVNTASMGGVVGYPGTSYYGVSKWGVVGMTKNAAIELGPRGIRVNCVCPTGVDTPMIEDPTAEHWATTGLRLANQHVDRLATAEEVAAAIHFLASDDASMVNGHALHVDGGLDAGISHQLLEAALSREIHDGEEYR